MKRWISFTDEVFDNYLQELRFLYKDDLKKIVTGGEFLGIASIQKDTDTFFQFFSIKQETALLSKNDDFIKILNSKVNCRRKKKDKLEVLSFIPLWDEGDTQIQVDESQKFQALILIEGIRNKLLPTIQAFCNKRLLLPTINSTFTSMYQYFQKTAERLVKQHKKFSEKMYILPDTIQEFNDNIEKMNDGNFRDPLSAYLFTSHQADLQYSRDFFIKCLSDLKTLVMDAQNPNQSIHPLQVILTVLNEVIPEEFWQRGGHLCFTTPEFQNIKKTVPRYRKRS